MPSGGMWCGEPGDVLEHIKWANCGTCCCYGDKAGESVITAIQLGVKYSAI